MALAKTQYDHTTALRGLGLAPPAPANTRSPRDLADFKAFADWAAVGLSWPYFIGDGLLDFIPPEEQYIPSWAKGPYVGWLSVGLLVVDCVNAGLSVPWLDGKGTAPGTTTADEVAVNIWMADTVGGPVVDIVLAVVSALALKNAGAARTARNFGDATVVYTFVRGVVGLAMHGWWSNLVNGENPASIAEGVFAKLPTLAKLVRLTRIGRRDPRWLVALVAVDVTGDLVAAICKTIQTSRDHSGGAGPAG